MNENDRLFAGGILSVTSMICSSIRFCNATSTDVSVTGVARFSNIAPVPVYFGLPSPPCSALWRAPEKWVGVKRSPARFFRGENELPGRIGPGFRCNETWARYAAGKIAPLTATGLGLSPPACKVVSAGPGLAGLAWTGRAADAARSPIRSASASSAGS